METQEKKIIFSGIQPVMVKRIGKTTYRVKLHFSETSKETMTDKIKRLILNDCAKEFEQSEKIS